MVKVWAAETAANSAWIASLGSESVLMEYHRTPEFPELDGSDCYAGYLHVPPTWGHSRLYRVLSRAAIERGARVRYATPAVELVRDHRGRVVGVRAEHDGRAVHIGARRGVVLATGGFAGSADMVRDHLDLVGAAPWGSPGNTGDGHRMAQQVGASLGRMRNFMPSVGLRAPGFDAGFAIAFPAAGHVFVGPDGRRFADETVRTGHGHGLIRGEYRIFPAEAMFAIFDERTRRSGPLSPRIDQWPYGWNQIVERYEWSLDNDREIEAGWIAGGETVEQLAGALGLDPAALVRAVADWNEACASGVDPLGRSTETLVPIDQPPFYGFRCAPNITYTCGGPRRNERAQVLDALGAVIPGLYCAGELSPTYTRCMDGGMMIADALAFGRIAGRGAAAEAPAGASRDAERPA
jgi:succinate dehydrogenase/fumarate reductase flavoprotein subunit